MIGTTFLSIFLSFSISALICFLEIVFGKYKLNHILVLKSPKYLIYYCILFGLISALITYLVLTGAFTINKFNFSDSPYLTAVCFGIATKSIAKVSIYSFSIDKKQYSVGPKILTDYLEDFLLKKINDDVDKQLIKAIYTVEELLKKNNTLTQMNEAVFQSLPTNLPAIKNKSYKKEITNYKNAFDKCRYIASNFGIERLKILEDILKSRN